MSGLYNQPAERVGASSFRTGYFGRRDAVFDPSVYKGRNRRIQEARHALYQQQAEQYGYANYDPNDPYDRIRREMAAKKGELLITRNIDAKTGKIIYTKSRSRDTNWKTSLDANSDALQQDYEQSYQPYEQAAVDPYIEGGDVDPDIAAKLSRDQAAARANAAFDIAGGAFNRARESTGIDMTPEERAAHDRRMSLGRGLSTVGASNLAQRAFDQRSKDVENYAFDAEGASEQMFSTALAKAAGAQQDRQNAKKMEKAQKKAGRNSMIGTGVGIVATVAAAF